MIFQLVCSIVIFHIAYGMSGLGLTAMLKVLDASKTIATLSAKPITEMVVPPNPFPGDCGRTITEEQTMITRFKRIVGGEKAKIHSHPWIVSLRRGRFTHSHYCGGTLVRVNRTVDESDIVITAAQCVKGGKAGLHVYLGSHWRSKKWAGERRIDVSKIVRHPGYKHIAGHYWNDIAVVRLARPVKFTKSIQPACLPFQDEKIPYAQKGTVAGWGSTQATVRSRFGRLSDVLNQVTLPLVPPSFCSSVYKRMNGIAFINEKTMLCAGYEMGGMDACYRDTGGPFVFGKKDGITGVTRYSLQGIVSWGDGCANPYGVYTRVAGFANWIQQTITSVTKVH